MKARVKATGEIVEINESSTIYDALCERIEWLIKEGYFNKEYLV